MAKGAQLGVLAGSAAQGSTAQLACHALPPCRYNDWVSRHGPPNDALKEACRLCLAYAQEVGAHARAWPGRAAAAQQPAVLVWAAVGPLRLRSPPFQRPLFTPNPAPPAHPQSVPPAPIPRTASQSNAYVDEVAGQTVLVGAWCAVETIAFSRRWGGAGGGAGRGRQGQGGGSCGARGA